MLTKVTFEFSWLWLETDQGSKILFDLTNDNGEKIEWYWKQNETWQEWWIVQEQFKAVVEG